ncbi:MAG TPA: nucleoside recognition domain-containing protein [Bacillota bacterium]|nr:nucleoside recognition domain-containing protein [Bacillota bacterium]
MAVMTDWHFWQQTALGLFSLIKQMAVIVIPLMLVMEIIKDAQVLDKLTGWLSWTVRPFALPTAAVFPLLVGLVFGLAYGAGLIIQASREGTLSKRDLYLISLFLVINHSAFEDTLLFVAIGANGWLVLIFRFVTSIAITWLVSKFFLPAQTTQNISH